MPKNNRFIKKDLLVGKDDIPKKLNDKSSGSKSEKLGGKADKLGKALAARFNKKSKKD